MILTFEKASNESYYRAFSAPSGDRQLHLILYAQEKYVMMNYDYLKDIIFDKSYQNIILVFSHQRVKIHGSNLKPIINALRTYSLEWIGEYIPSEMQISPDNQEEPLTIIEKIEFDEGECNSFNKGMATI